MTEVKRRFIAKRKHDVKDHNTANFVTFVKETELLLLWSLVINVDYQVSEMESFSIAVFHRYFFCESSKSGTIGPKFISEADTGGGYYITAFMSSEFLGTFKNS